MKKTLILLLLTGILAGIAGCRHEMQIMDGPGMVDTREYTTEQNETGENSMNTAKETEKAATFRQITPAEAYDLMRDASLDCIILDVRREDEFAQGHIPGAICIPIESITDTPPAQLPDRDQTILVYCRSGRRSKQAAQNLADMGYTDVREFGGILDWPYETEM